ncbi:hypothetical protein JCM10908_001653 [Rhodotorula pacifica]|uniref:uncharacterized protein n=1 Tax=Rhodotorula pacifica TaxID=1495444 RepID=UPI00317F23A0
MGRSTVPFDLLDLFPAASTSTSAPVLVDTASIAFIGQLPAAAPIHLALNHLRHGEHDRAAEAMYERGDGLIARARGKQRAREGSEEDDENVDSADEDMLSPTSEPMRIESAVTSLPRRVLVLAPDRDQLRDRLVQECEGSLAGDRLDGPDQALLDCIDIRYLPTSSHLTYFLSTAYGPQDFAAGDAHAAAGHRRAQDPSWLPYPPSMVILLSPSTYLREPAVAEAGVAGLASLLAHLFATFTRGAFRSPTLVVFDEDSPEASLPLLPQHLRARHARQPKPDERDGFRLRSVFEHFCEWTGQVEQGMILNGRLE